MLILTYPAGYTAFDYREPLDDVDMPPVARTFSLDASGLTIAQADALMGMADHDTTVALLGCPDPDLRQGTDPFAPNYDATVRSGPNELMVRPWLRVDPQRYYANADVAADTPFDKIPF